MQGTLGNEGPKRLTTEERMKLLRDTLKKSSRLTENLLRRLDKEWEDVFKEESGTNVDQPFCAFSKYSSDYILKLQAKILRFFKVKTLGIFDKIYEFEAFLTAKTQSRYRRF